IKILKFAQNEKTPHFRNVKNIHIFCKEYSVTMRTIRPKVKTTPKCTKIREIPHPWNARVTKNMQSLSTGMSRIGKSGIEYGRIDGSFVRRQSQIHFSAKKRQNCPTRATTLQLDRPRSPWKRSCSTNAPTVTPPKVSPTPSAWLLTNVPAGTVRISHASPNPAGHRKIRATVGIRAIAIRTIARRNTIASKGTSWLDVTRGRARLTGHGCPEIYLLASVSRRKKNIFLQIFKI
ncbi:unnamed protein product, partial [Nesidiocoris tenuis]